MYQTKRLFHYFIVGCFLMFTSMTTTSCGAQQKLAKKAGMRSNTVRIAKLGSDYKKLENTEYDFFNPKKNIVKLTKRKKPIGIKYNTFKVSSLDSVITQSNILYAQYKFADIIANQFAEGLDVLTTNKLFDVQYDDLRNAARTKDPEKIRQIKKIKNLYHSVGLIKSSTKSLVDSSMKLKDDCMKIQQNIKKDFVKDPIKAVMLPQMLEELKSSISKLADVIQGTPSIVGKISKIRQLGDLDKQYDRLKDLF
jgi:hypothetical protein